MIDKFRKIFRKFPALFKVLSRVYQTFVAPIESGHVQYYIKYLFTLKYSEVKKLKYYGLENIKPVNYREWRIGKGKDHAYRRYYLGKYHGKKCFIKIGKNDATVENECLFGEQFSHAELTFSPNFLIGDSSFDTNTTMVAVEYLEGLQKFTVPTSIEEFSNLCVQFNYILDVLLKNDIVHADIHKGNLMTQNGKLILMDYGISMKKSSGNKIDYNARPGTFYRENLKNRIYDDAFSFVEMIQELNLPDAFISVDEFQKIVSKIGRNYVNVKLK